MTKSNLEKAIEEIEKYMASGSIKHRSSNREEYISIKPGKVSKGSITPAQIAKSMGFKSLKEVSELCTISCATLGNWLKHKPVAFHAILLGCLVIKESNNNK